MLGYTALWAALLVAGSFLFGSTPAGLLVVRAARGVDVRRFGSGNVGTVNVYRTAGLWPAAIVGLIDVLKGALPVLVARAVGLGPLVQVLGAGAAIVGHNWSPFLRFEGGKGVASTFGAVAALDLWSLLVAALAWMTTVGVTRYASLGSMLGSCVVPVIMALRGLPLEYTLFGVAAAAMVLYRHKGNIKRLIQGKELRVNQKVGAPAAEGSKEAGRGEGR